MRASLSAAAKNTDTFDDDIQTYNMGTIDRQIQATHTYIDTIYVHKGTSVTLKLPTVNNDGGLLSNTNYVRWYNYRTDETFELQSKTGRNPTYDLLTPLADDYNKQVPTLYRFANGYVGGNCVGVSLPYNMNFYYPTTTQFDDWKTENPDNDWYIVACDVSPYNDFSVDYNWKGSKFGSNNTYHEPTLGARILFYIISVDDRDGNWNNNFYNLTKDVYQGGGNGTDDKYLEEYDITFPSHHISNYTPELVALSKDARSYAIPGANNNNDNTTLNVSMTSDNSDLTLLNNTVIDTSRVIQFKKRGVDDNDPWFVNDGTKATILVTKKVNGTTYNIARYNLTFKKETSPLTQSQVAALATPSDIGDNKWYKDLTYRSPDYMKQNLKLLTSLTFDYDTSIGDDYGNSKFYPYPIAWNNSSYAFYDGATSNDAYASSYDFPEWGTYSLVKDYVGWGENESDNNKNPNLARPTEGLAKENGTYFIYVDASDRPGTIVRLPFEENLCQGSELFVTAWVKSSGTQTGNNDAALLFTLMGANTDTEGNTTYTPIYRQSSGQIRTTTWLTSGEPGTGVGKNEWFQVYFSFINQDNKDYDFYVVQVDNNCASTAGGDFYFDEIKVYLMQPTATITQLEATCTTKETLMRMDFDYERLMSRLGHDVNKTYEKSEIEGIDFCFVDEVKYNKYLTDNPGKTADAIDASIVTMGTGENARKYPTFRFYLNYESNTLYGEGGKHLAGENMIEVDGATEKRAFFYKRDDESGTRMLTVDFYSLLTPNRPYLILIKPYDSETEYANAEEFAADIDNPCSIQTRFYVTTQTLLKVNGEVIDPSVDYCTGQTFNFSAQVRVPVGEDYITIDNGVYFDWFFGTEEEFTTDNNTYGTNLHTALTSFRAVYPDAETLDEINTPPVENRDKETFTQKEYNLIAYYLGLNGEEGGINGRLVLHKENLDIRMLNDGLQLVMQPIPTLVPPTEGGVSSEDWAKVCWSYIPLLLNASGESPTLNAGFGNTQYPANYIPALRIGLNQIKKIKDANSALRIRLRDAKLVSDDAAKLGKVSKVEDLDKLYLIGSDDPEYSDIFTAADFDQYSLPIGTITELSAEEYQEGSSFNDYADVYFDIENTTTLKNTEFKFTPKEGYYYKFSIHFEEKDANGAKTGNSCQGSFPIEMKVVPEYLVWKGGRTSNWNKDDNWQRADATELNKNDYTTNKENTTSNGFVPMLFSKVIMQKDSKAELYMAGYNNSQTGSIWDSDRPDYMEMPTENIQYDLMAYDNANGITTERYRVDMCDQIHFEPGAQLLNAQMLIYKKTWVDIEIPDKQWQLVTMTLKDIYSGDWYTATSGTEAEKEYFTDRYFGNGDNRLNPAVFQRSWDAEAYVIESSSSPVTAPNYAQTGWTSAYNDASVPYTAGIGFSIKAYRSQGTDDLLFRFPKADKSYTVSSTTGDLKRTNAGKLLASDLATRVRQGEGNNVYFEYQENEEGITVTPTVSEKGYCIVGNPFTAPMSIKAFMAANDNLTGSYWQETDKGPIAGNATTDNWITSDGEDDVMMAPYKAFFVQMKSDATNKTTVKFTAGMQKFSETEGHNTVAFSIKATNANGESSTALAYAEGASNGYDEKEDVILLQDVASQESNVPLVYTAAGDKAVSVNCISSLQVIPVGLFGQDNQVTTLAFTGVEHLSDPKLYDAETGSTTPLTEGYEIELTGSSYGRYFIRTSGANTTGITDVNAEDDIQVSSMLHRQVVVTAQSGIEEVTVWSASGVLLAKASPNGDNTCTLNNVASGMAVVKVTTANGTSTQKTIIR